MVTIMSEMAETALAKVKASDASYQFEHRDTNVGRVTLYVNCTNTNGRGYTSKNWRLDGRVISAKALAELAPKAVEPKADNQALEQANAQMASVREMVAALAVDYDRLEELRGELDQLQDELDDAARCVRHHHNGELDESGACVEHDEWRRCRDELEDWQCDNAEELAELEAAAGDCSDIDDAETRIDQDALSVEVRSGWQTQHDEPEWAEFRVVLCTGGPHVQIRGELAQGEPTRAWLEYSDWGTGMVERVNEEGDEAALLAYASRFFHGY